MNRRVLGLFAHPDDETFGPGGTLALLGARGDRVRVVCATRGEAGTIDRSAFLGKKRLAALRETELAAACRALGIEPPSMLHLPDGGLHRLDPETLQRPFVRAIREYRPDILITFHSGGISGHRDHRTVTVRALEAFEMAADPDRWPYLGAPWAAARVWCYSLPESQAARVTFRTLHAVPDDEIDAVLDVSRHLAAERAAVGAHASQKAFVDHLESFLGDLDGFWSEEAFVLAAARTPLPRSAARPVDDLFLGMPPTTGGEPDREGGPGASAGE
jgi:LmbE family N-acetylglucosaminyl deacetylase